MDTPDKTLTQPLLPDAEAPLASDIEPDMPDDVAARDETVSDPEPADVLLPVTIVTEPPAPEPPA